MDDVKSFQKELESASKLNICLYWEKYYLPRDLLKSCEI